MKTEISIIFGIVEQVVGDTIKIILQEPPGQNKFQDVAMIEIEETGNEHYKRRILLIKVKKK